MGDVLRALIYASEKAANVARACCTRSGKDNLIVAEKAEGQANTRFDKDFKTIADVLAQESARKEISLHCPDLVKQLRGEECAEINGIAIEVCDTEEETTDLLCSLTSVEAARKMSEAVHAEINIDIDLPTDLQIDLNFNDLGVWIDPIDATAEFISGVRGEADAEEGLPCVTVLIGAYSQTTGEPVIGVINQPFYNNGQGRIIWGVCHGDTKIWSDASRKGSVNKTVMMSSAESPSVTEKFSSSGWEVKFVPGAGNKLLKVALGEAAAYIVSKGTTFRWDTCAPHAILKAQGGDIVSFKTHIPITYNDPTGIDTRAYANSEGIIAYTGVNTLQQLLKLTN